MASNDLYASKQCNKDAKCNACCTGAGLLAEASTAAGSYAETYDK
jgi:hypothetical protein